MFNLFYQLLSLHQYDILKPHNNQLHACDEKNRTHKNEGG